MYAASWMQPIQIGGATANVKDGTFEIVPPLFGNYRLDVFSLPGNFYVAETWVNRVRVTDGLLDIPQGIDNVLEFVLSPDGGEINGTVVDKQLVPQRGVRGLLLPDPPLQRAIGAGSREFVTSANGDFTLYGIAPGNYRLFACDGVDQYEYFDPDLLGRSRPDATRVIINRGAKVRVTVEIIKKR